MKIQSVLTRNFVFIFFIACLVSSCTQRRYGHMNFQRSHAPSLVKNTNDSKQSMEKSGGDHQLNVYGLAQEKVDPINTDLNNTQDVPMEMKLGQQSSKPSPKLVEGLLYKKLLKSIEKAKTDDSKVPTQRIETSVKPDQIKDVSHDERKKQRSILYILVVILIILLIVSLAKNILGPFLWSILILAILITILGRVLGWW